MSSTLPSWPADMTTVSGTVPVTTSIFTTNITSGQLYANDSFTFAAPAAGTVTCSDVILKGKSLSSMFEKIEERLCILQPNADLESRWSELKSLKEQYQKLEKELLEKEKMWSVLKT